MPPLHVSAIIMVLALANAYWASWSSIEALIFGGQTDWSAHTDAGLRILAGVNPYTEALGFFGLRWSPIISSGFGLIAWLPFWAWAALHVVAAFGFRQRWLIVLVLLSWPFILDTIDGGIMVFVGLAAYWAYRGSHLGTLTFFAFALLVPRPLVLPLLAWLLWKRPETRWSFVVLFVVHAAVVLVSGWGDEWIARLLESGIGPIADPVNIGPSRIVGSAWMWIGAPLAAWLTWKGRLGWASMAVSPYILPPYLLMMTLEAGPRVKPTRSPGAIGRLQARGPAIRSR